MTLRDLSLAELRELHRTELHEAFPEAELKPYAAMAHLCRRGVYHPIGAFEGATLVGYAILWSSPDERYVLIDHLGVTKARRNGGLGGEILRRLAARYAALDGILVESEAPEGGASDALRRRRLGFYRRSGFTLLDYECILFSVHYAVALCSPNGRGTEAAAMAAHRSLYRSQLAPWAYDRFIQIPLDPARPVAPTESWAGQTTLPGLGEEERNDRR